MNWRTTSVAVLVLLPFAVATAHEFSARRQVMRALTHCHRAGRAEVQHLTAADPGFYRTQTQVVKACMAEGGYAFDHMAVAEILAAYRSAEPATSLDRLGQLEYRLVMEREHWRTRWFWEQTSQEGKSG
jgi:hypothetical protein